MSSKHSAGASPATKVTLPDPTPLHNPQRSYDTQATTEPVCGGVHPKAGGREGVRHTP